jgi:hypothetical protein
MPDVSPKPFLIGAYNGLEKPSSANDFLKDFVEEFNYLCANGLNNTNTNIVFQTLICDAPAKSFVTLTKGHSGFYSCSKCEQKGRYLNGRVCFPILNTPPILRTDTGFVQRNQEQHHLEVGVSLLETIPNFGMVTNVPLDYMHLVLLGVMRKLINLWIRGKVPNRLGSQMVLKASNRLTDMRNCMPDEFARRPQPLKHIDNWKATELRQILLYSGPIVFRRVLDPEKYLHFLALHVSLRILSSVKHIGDEANVHFADELLQYFVKNFGRIYGRCFMSHNIHGLLHIADDVRKFGTVDTFCAFPFENFMQELKKYVRKSEKPLQQLARRYAELEAVSIANPEHSNRPVTFSGLHTDGPLPHGICTDPQYRKAKLKCLTLGTNEANNCALTHRGEIIVVSNIAYCPQEQMTVLIGNAFQEKEDLYKKPLKSSSLGIYKVTSLSTATGVWKFSYIDCKLVKLPFGRYHAVFPLLHSDI